MSVSIFGAGVLQQTVFRIEVQVKLHRRGLPRWRFSGQVGTEVREGKERIFAALQKLKVVLPRAGVTVALLPAEKKKQGSSLDLALALALLQAHQLVPTVSVAAVAELDMEGALHSVEQEYALVHHLLSFGGQVILPRERFALWHDHPRREQLIFCSTLAQAIEYLRNPQSFSVYLPEALPQREESPPWPLSPSLLRILSLALIGRHPTLFLGAPGVGKSYLSVLAEYLLPNETATEKAERLARQTLSQVPITSRVLMVPPTTSQTKILSSVFPSGSQVLFFDELPEFARSARESLRQFLEISPLAEAAKELRSTVLATANPCPCGYAGTPKCRCRPDEKQQYAKRLSGPLLDRFSLVWRITDKDHRLYSGEEWQQVKRQFAAAVARQKSRVDQGFPEYAHNYKWESLRRLVQREVFDVQEASFRRQLFPYQVAQTLCDWEGGQDTVEDRYWEAAQLCGIYSAEVD